MNIKQFMEIQFLCRSQRNIVVVIITKIIVLVMKSMAGTTTGTIKQLTMHLKVIRMQLGMLTRKFILL